MRKRIVKHCLSASVASLCVVAPMSAASLDTQTVSINDVAVSEKVWHKLIMPGEVMNVSLPDGYAAEISGQQIDRHWRAPSEPDNLTMKVTDEAGTTRHKISVFVLEPSANIDERGYLGKFRMGFYPKNTPVGFIKLEKEDREMRVSPSFKVGQFICKQQANEWPKYLLVSENNLTRLEFLLESLRKDDITEARSLYVMSGYRTPFYNTAIGSAKFSRHMYGDAADVYVDVAPRDGVMDDLNKDGTIDKRDANYFYDYAQKLYKSPKVVKGGIGSYKANAVHGPFVHVDARGNSARWGR